MSPLRRRPLRPLTIVSAAVAASGALAASAPASTHHGAVYRADTHATVKPRIVGGGPITIDKAPWQVFLRAEDPVTGAYYACGGSIIDATTIMTAGHCLFDETTGLPFPVSEFEVWAGVSQWDPATGNATGGQSSAVTDAIPHPYYQPAVGGGGTPDQLQDDVAVLKLTTPLSFNADVQPISLGTENSAPAIGGSAQVTGFGRQDANDVADPDGRLYALGEIIQDPALAGADNAVFTLGAASGGSFCSGDSGSGLTASSAVIGVVSATPDCHPGTPNLYTNVTAGEIQEFVLRGSGAPPRAPRGGTDVVLRGPDATPSKGDALTCSAGTWSNSPTYTYTFTDTRNGRVLQSGASATYRVTGTSDAGATISCRVAAANAGGVGLTPPTQATPAVQAAPQPKPQPTPTPTPKPTPTPTPPKHKHHKHKKQPKAHYKVSSSISASKSRVRRGKTVTYTVHVRNRGNRRLRHVRSCVKLSSRYTLVSRHHGKVSHGSICWTNRSLRVKHRATHHVKVRIDRDARLGRFKTRLHVRADPHGSDSAVRSVRVQRAARRRAPSGPPDVTG